MVTWSLSLSLARTRAAAAKLSEFRPITTPAARTLLSDGASHETGTMAKDDSQTISVPYLLILLVLAAAILRLLFFSNSSGGTPPAGRHNPLNVLRAREAAVERIQQMFPQVERRTILWDLQRNGGNVQTTSERILAGRIETVSSFFFFFFLPPLLLFPARRATV